MENKTNIAELLKYCPKGMELDCSMWDNVVFDHIDTTSNYPIYIKKMGGELEYLTEDGHFNFDCDAKCVIFPKGKTTWEGFVPPCEFKDGDIVYVKTINHHEYILIFKEIKNDHIHKYVCFTYQRLSIDKCPVCLLAAAEIIRLATEEEKKKLFDAIKENGYRWSLETKTLEKLTKFKVGDKIKHKDSGIYCTLGEYSEGISAYRTNIGLSLTYKDMEQWELVPNKFDIDTLVPFESRVLVRNGDRDHWRPAIFGGYAKNKDNEIEYYYALGGTCWRNCIPYEGNEHLSTTTNDCDKYYKNW